MIFTSHRDGYVDHCGVLINEWDTEFDCPFVPGTLGGSQSKCWVIYRGIFGSWKIRECYVMSVKFTNCWLLCMDNGWEYFSDRIGTEVFEHDDLNKAIRICEEKNRMRKVKIKRLN